MLITMKELLDRAYAGGYAVAAPNVYDQFTMLGCLRAAEELRAPVIIDYGEREGDIENFGRIAVPLAQAARVPVAINLDHGKQFSSMVKSVRYGFTSVMADHSDLPLEDNIARVRAVADMAHSVEVTVESELGHLVERSAESAAENSALTDPDEAWRFVGETGVDCLAVAIGTAHGAYRGKPFLDFDRLKKINERLGIPLVLHGGSGTGEEALTKAIGLGISKINIATDLFVPAGKAVKDYYASEERPAFQLMSIKIMESFAESLERYIKMFGSAGKA